MEYNAPRFYNIFLSCRVPGSDLHNPLKQWHEGPALICSRSPGHTPPPSGVNDTDSPAGRHPKTETERLLERHNGSKSPSIVSTRGNKTKPIEKASSIIPDESFQGVLRFSSPYRLFYVRNIPLINILFQRAKCKVHFMGWLLLYIVLPTRLM
jgi:hypothetical protein